VEDRFNHPRQLGPERWIDRDRSELTVIAAGDKWRQKKEQNWDKAKHGLRCFGDSAKQPPASRA
jgi:hypothetical protein